jgi:AbiV family abortive infection protein
MVKRLPDEVEAATGAKIAAESAAGLLSDADRLASAGSYGRALSLAVLAFEESVKARTLAAIVAAHGGPLGFTDEDLRKIIYNNHQTRHSAGLLQHLAVAHPNIYGKLMFGMAVDSAEAAAVKKLTDLIAPANAGKQAGFYADFDPNSGSWSSPGDVRSAEFEEVRALAGEFMVETLRQIDAL